MVDPGSYTTRWDVNQLRRHHRHTALATVFVAGIASSVVTLIPIRVLHGEKVIHWSRTAWIALEGTAIFIFVEVLLRAGSGYVNHDRSTNLGLILLPFIAFALASVSFWAYFRLRPEPTETPHELAIDDT